ncbi:unnamed protein product [Closterium sp. Naga37s-1]|nr:unnamed protein product [Closterium sp. Naga37s-1]
MVFNRQILPNGKKPLGRQKVATGLELYKLGDLVCAELDGTRVIKSLETLTREIGTKKKAKRALKAFGCIPETWKQKLLAPLTEAELLAESEYVKVEGSIVPWKIDKVEQGELVCRACDCTGTPLEGEAERVTTLDPYTVQPLIVREGRVIGAAGLPEVRLRVSELCAEGQLPLFKLLRGLFEVPRGEARQHAKWAEDWGKQMDWASIIRVRDSPVLPNRARDVLLRLHCRNLQVEVRLRFLEGVLCPHCGEEETAEHCTTNGSNSPPHPTPPLSLLSLLLLRLSRALTTLPTPSDLRFTLLTIIAISPLVYLFASWADAFYLPQAGFPISLILFVFVFPSFWEELFLRVLLNPHPAEPPSPLPTWLHTRITSLLSRASSLLAPFVSSVPILRSFPLPRDWLADPKEIWVGLGGNLGALDGGVCLDVLGRKAPGTILKRYTD